ncbi:uncharacterized protein LOC108712236 [Xenopus laevis]|uniref:Uncharacterized protein LOC108712236 n=2 Tax=Xenopus laevis TaxID=8355 RepID=A0A1L8HWF4_XENLA|nr:uncharacterized protein LOC108712236 [Xenopus laevis]OCU00396.1 hypothetical protein XELAEV_18006168mg [Xenopus laevis]
MGAYASTFPNSGGNILLEVTDPSQSNWITAHAETCKMSIPEVQKCWNRFLILGPDSSGNIKRSSLLSKNPFTKQILQQIPVVNNEVITFQTYCSAVSWLAKAPQESKLRGLYHVLTSKELTMGTLKNLLHNLYPNDGSNVIEEMCHLLFSEIDKSKKGVIDEDQFVSWIQSMPKDHVASVLDFRMISPELQSRDLSLSSVSPQIYKAVDEKGRLRDDQLHQVATAIAQGKRDWRLLANKLGFLEKDCIFFEKNHHEAKDQILDMLQTWRNTLGGAVQSQILQDALKKSGNADIANEIFKLNF